MDIKEIKKSLKLKGDELSEMTIRKDLLEKKLSNINKDHETENANLKVLLKLGYPYQYFVYKYTHHFLSVVEKI